jgi:hypothetical protein
MKTGTAILIICILNFVAFGIGSMMIGGSATNGLQENGRFFVSEHGKNTEVTKQVWNYSLWHSRSLIVTHPLAMILLLILGVKWDEKRKQMIEQSRGANALSPESPAQAEGRRGQE